MGNPCPPRLSSCVELGWHCTELPNTSPSYRCGTEGAGKPGAHILTGFYVHCYLLTLSWARYSTSGNTTNISKRGGGTGRRWLLWDLPACTDIVIFLHKRGAPPLTPAPFLALQSLLTVGRQVGLDNVSERDGSPLSFLWCTERMFAVFSLMSLFNVQKPVFQLFLIP